MVSAHLGARTQREGFPYLSGHENWQGKVYKIRGSEEGFPNLLEMTGYDIDPNGKGKVVNPLGLHGYNCRHSHKPWDKELKNPYIDENGNLKIDIVENRGKYEAQQKQRAMERAIRKTKRELLMKQTEIDGVAEVDVKEMLQPEYDKLSYRLREQNEAYDKFCKENGLQKHSDRLKVAGFKRQEASKTSASARAYEHWKLNKGVAKSTNTGARVSFDSAKDYRIDLPNYSKEINDKLSEAARELAKRGSADRFEHGVFVNLETGEIDRYVTDEMPDSVWPNYKYLKANPNARVAFLHNHNTDTELSFPDVAVIANDKEINIVVAVRNDGIITLVESNGLKTKNYLPSEYSEYANNIRKRMMVEKGYVSEIEVEIELRNRAIEEFAIGGIQIYGSDS